MIQVNTKHLLNWENGFYVMYGCSWCIVCQITILDNCNPHPTRQYLCAVCLHVVLSEPPIIPNSFLNCFCHHVFSSNWEHFSCRSFSVCLSPSVYFPSFFMSFFLCVSSLLFHACSVVLLLRGELSHLVLLVHVTVNCVSALGGWVCFHTTSLIIFFFTSHNNVITTVRYKDCCSVHFHIDKYSNSCNMISYKLQVTNITRNETDCDRKSQSASFTAQPSLVDAVLHTNEIKLNFELWVQMGWLVPIN